MKKMKAKEVRRPEMREEPRGASWKDVRGGYRAENLRLSEEEINEEIDCSFSECVLDHIVFANSAKSLTFTDVEFRACDFSNAVFDGSTFQRCVFTRCRMLGTSWIRCTFRDVILQDSLADYANFSSAQFDTCRFEASRFTDAALAMCRFKDTAVKSCAFAHTEFAGTPLTEMDFSDSDIEGIIVRPEDLRGASVNYRQAAELAVLLGLVIKE